MVISPYRTSVTAAHQDFGKRVSPDVTNRKALGREHRRAEWLRRNAS